MNRRQLEYAVKLAAVRNFSQLSTQLGISQPALSKHIQALEEELQVKLFDRSTSPLSLTPAGMFFMEHAKELLHKEDQLVQKMEQYRSGEAGLLTIGVSPFRCSFLMPPIVRAVRERFPHVQVMLCTPPSAELRRDTAEGKFDFSILNLPIDDALLETTAMTPETVVLAVPRDMAGQLPDSEELSFSACARLPFVTVKKGQEMRDVLDTLCAVNGVTPTIAAEIEGGITAAWALVGGGIGATLLPDVFASEQHDNVVYYRLSPTPYTRYPAVVTRRGQYLSPYAQYAIDLLTT